MAKIPFSKLDLKFNDTVNTFTCKNSKGEDVSYEVKYYLPLEDKVTLITNVINQSVDEFGFYNPMKIKLFTALEIVYAYTNLTFTPKQKENVFKLYDILLSSGTYDNILSYIRDEDIADIEKDIWTTIDNIYKYRNSALGILERMKEDYNGLNLEATGIQEKLADPQNLALVKDILEKLG